MADIIVILGPPGSGKTDHSKRLSQLSQDYSPIYHVSVGDRIRDIRTGKVNSAFSNVEINDSAVPEHIKHLGVDSIVFEYISGCPSNSIVLVDGYPKFPEAVGVFLKSIEENKHSLLGCVNLSISSETSLSRVTRRGVRMGERITGDFSGGFANDRYSQYTEHTLGVIKTLGEIAPVITIDAESNINTVWESYCNAINELVNHRLQLS